MTQATDLRDVVVVGAGPAGLMRPRAAGAARARRRRARRTPRHRRAGALHRPSRPRSVLRTRHSAPHHPRAPRTRRGSSRPTAARSCRRRSRATRRSSIARCSIRRLADSSRAAGADLRTRRARRARSRSPTRRVTIRPTARTAIAARAVHPGVRRELSLQPAARPRRARASSCRARSSKCLSRPGTVEVHLGRTIAPRGFAWVVPFRARRAAVPAAGPDGRSRARAHDFRSFATQLRAALRHRRRRGRSRASRSSRSARSQDHGTAPARRRRRGRARQADHRRRHLLQPESAASSRPRTVEALRDERPRESRLRQYERRWRERLGAEIRIGLAFRLRRLATHRSRHRLDSSSSPASTASSRCCGRPPTSTGIAPPRAPSCATRSSAGSCSLPSGRSVHGRAKWRSPPATTPASRSLAEPRRAWTPRQPVSPRAPAGRAAGGRAAARLRLRRRDVRRDGPRPFPTRVGADVEPDQVR